MDLFDIAIARKLSGGGGGGGGGDFYKANIQVLADGFEYIFVPLNMETNQTVGVTYNSEVGLFIDEIGTTYQGAQEFVWYILNDESIYLADSNFAASYAVSGSAEVSSVMGQTAVRIFGDCTITLS